MKYAQTGTVEFRDEDGDSVVVRAEPTGSQYDERMNILGTMKIPGNLINNNTNMEDLFAGGEMVEVNVDKKQLTEFQFKALFVSMTVGGKTVTAVSEAIGMYRKFDKETKDWIDEKIDTVWKAHEEAIKEVERVEGECEPSLANSSEGDVHPLDFSRSTPNSSEPSETT